MRGYKGRRAQQREDARAVQGCLWIYPRLSEDVSKAVHRYVPGEDGKVQG